MLFNFDVRTMKPATDDIMWVYLFCLTYKAKWAKTLMSDAKINGHRNSQLSLNPLSPNGDQHQFSPNDIHTLSSD